MGPGHILVNTLTNSPERLVTEVATVLSRAASVNGSRQMADGSDVLSTLKVSRASAIVLDPDLTDSPWTIVEKLLQLSEDNTVTSEELPHLKMVYLIRRREKGEEDFWRQLNESQEWFQADDTTPDNMCGVFNTSDSTGFSKLVVHTHKNVVRMVHGTSLLYLRNADGKVEFSMAPMGWMGGHPVIVIMSGVTRVTLDLRSADLSCDLADFIWKTIVEEK